MPMTWGSTDITCYVHTYRPPVAGSGIVELQLLPNPADPDAVCSILQQTGRTRKRAYWEGYVRDIADYESLLADHLNAMTRTFVGPDGTSLSCIIESIEVTFIQDDLINYSITLVEA